MRGLRLLVVPLLLSGCIVIAPPSRHRGRRHVPLPAPQEAPVVDASDTRALYDALPLPDTFAAWEPSPGETLAALLVVDDEWDAAAEQWSPEFRVSVLRAGLRLPPSEASWLCARQLDWRHMDVAEHRVAVGHIVNAVCDPAIDTWDGEFWSLLECFGAADIPAIHAMMDGVDPLEMERASDDLLHKVTHAEHLSLIAEYMVANDVPDRAGDDRIWLVIEFTDRNREAVARCLVGDDAIAAEPRGQAGLAPGLRACLEFLLDPGDLYAGAVDRYRNWAERWLRDSVPSERDLDLLLRVDRAKWSGSIVPWSLRHLDDERSRAYLIENAYFDEDVPWESTTAARGALAYRGDARAVEALRAQCTVDDVALALLLEAAPEVAVEEVWRAVTYFPFFLGYSEGESEDVRWQQCHWALHDAHTKARLDYGTAWDASVLAVLEERVLAAPISAARLAGLAVTVPALRTRAVITEALLRMGDAPPEDEIDGGEWYFAEDWWAMVEVAAPKAFRERLRAWTNDPRPKVAATARAILLQIGDPASGPLLVESARAGAEEIIDAEGGLSRLALSGGPEVEEYLREIVIVADNEEVRWDAAAGLAVLAGLPASLLDQGTFWASDAEDDGALDAFVRLALEGRGVDAYVELLRRAPDEQFWGAGDVDDPRVTAYLQRLRQKRHLKAYAFATWELAIQGDEGARAEQWAAISRGLYRWCDDDDARTATLGFDTGLIDYWGEFLEASDCQEPTASVTLHHLTGIKFRPGENHTPAAAFRAWRADHPGPLVWCRLLGVFVPAPR